MHITITGQWLNHFEPTYRGKLVRNIFSLASQKGWDVRVARQRW